MSGAGSTQIIFHSPSGSPEHRATAPWASPVKMLPNWSEGYPSTKASIACISPFFGPVKDGFCEHSGGAAAAAAQAQSAAPTPPFPVRG